MNCAGFVTIWSRDCTRTTQVGRTSCKCRNQLIPPRINTNGHGSDSRLLALICGGIDLWLFRRGFAGGLPAWLQSLADGVGNASHHFTEPAPTLRRLQI